MKTITSIMLLSLMGLLLSGTKIKATPQFAAQYKQTCNLCHHNPTGGGMRSLYGSQYFSYTDLPMEPVEDIEELEQFQPELSDNFQIGVDFRSLYWNDFGKSDTDPDGNSFLTMQGDLYFAFKPTDRAIIYVEKGLTNHYEAFALLQGFPMAGAIKFGRFVPNYGWRFSDHNTYVRDALGFSQYPTKGAPLIEDTGIEIGFYPMEWEFSLALTNGAPGAIDGDVGKAVTARSATRFSLFDSDITLGASYRYNQIGLPTPDLRYGGGFWAVSISDITYLGETDWIQKDGKSGFVASHKIDYRIKRGWDVGIGYDFYDADTDLKDGASWRGRLSSNIYLTGYLELIPAIEIHEDNNRNYSTAQMQMHVWF